MLHKAGEPERKKWLFLDNANSGHSSALRQPLLMGTQLLIGYLLRPAGK